VTVHEFGHALACRQAGGQANRIVLWPLGGVAYVNPPPRPGATLWSIAAGPLVNVALVFVLGLLVLGARVVGDFYGTDIYAFMKAVFLINLLLLVFNILPIYPLDGGQILRSLLWFIIGPIRSLMAVAIIGFIGAAALILFALFAQSVWIGAVAVFILLNCWGGLQQALMLARVAKAPPPLTDVPPDQLNITQ
ncbi:MAG TPA: site-2 protease family protein, partial [Terriglobales bacterium]|jgi:Zn-dependent protease